jgi:hypothetical protein
MRTYADILQHVDRVLKGQGGRSASQDQMRTAVQTAWEKLPAMHDWNWFTKRLRIWIAASYSTGTVSYSSSTGIMTLSGGTWPTWAAGCTVRISDISYPVSERLGGTTVLIDSNVAPSADLSAQSYTLHNDSHSIPTDFLAVGSDMILDRHYKVDYVSPGQMEDEVEESGIPDRFCIEPGTGTVPVLRVRPLPTSSHRMECRYRRRGRALRHSGLDARDYQGKVSVSGTAITGSGTAFTSSMVGAVLRLGTTDQPPGAIEERYPYAEELVVKSVQSALAATAESAASASFATVHYRVTDRVDATEPLYQLLVALALDELSEILRTEIPSRSREALARASDAEAGSRRLGSVGDLGPGGHYHRWWKGTTVSQV